MRPKQKGWPCRQFICELRACEQAQALVGMAGKAFLSVPVRWEASHQLSGVGACTRSKEGWEV